MKPITIFLLLFAMTLSVRAQTTCVAVNDTAYATMNTVTGIYVQANDSCPGSCLYVSPNTLNGNATVSGSGLSSFISYTPNQGYAGTDQFVYYNVNCNTGSIIDSAMVFVNVAYSGLGFSLTLASNTNPVNCNGFAILSLQNGVAPYLIKVNGVLVATTHDLTDTLHNLCAGTYDVIVTDSLGSSSSATFTIGNEYLYASPSIQYSAIGDSCGASAYVNITGGIAPYTILWSNGSTLNPDTSLCYGAYSVTVTDAIGSQIIANFVIQAQPVGCYPTTTPSSLCGCTGSVYLQANGGFPPYTYLLSNGAVSNNFTGLCAGTYGYTVTDSHNVSFSDSVTVTNESFVVSTQVINALLTNCNGSVSLVPSGGCPPYSYAWSGGETTSTVSGLCAGTYLFTITDNTGLELTGMATVISVSQSPLCNSANPFCTGTSYNYPAGTNSMSAESGPNYGCLASQPNPAWYYMMIEQPGDLVIYMHSNPQNDIDFAVWGPFTSPSAPCNGQLTAICSSCPNNTTDQNFYPSGNLVDCSYSTSWNETVHIQNAQPGQFYILLITNYSNQMCNILFDQTNAGQPGAGVASCDVFPVHVSGNIFNDLNNNQQKETGEAGISNAIVAVENADVYYNSDVNGNYTAHMNYGSNIVSVPMVSPYATVNPNSYAVSQTEVNKNFAVYYTPNVADLMVTLTNITAAVPGFSVNYELTYFNPGTITQSGSVKLIKANELTFVGSNPAITSMSGDTMIWDFANLNPMEMHNVVLQFTLPSTVTLGTILNNVANITPVSSDFEPTNNADSLNQIVVGSYDPNLKEVAPTGDLYIDNTNQDMKMEYTIHFQNEGTANAITVRVEDLLSDYLYLPSLQILSSSSPCELSVWGHKVNFTFNNINLPPKSVNEAGSQGFVKFAIQLGHNLMPGALIQNSADIYFDFNTAIVTNTVSTLIKGVSTEAKIVSDNNTQLLVSPNPSNGRARIYFDSKTNQQASVIVTNMLGSVVYKQNRVTNGTAIDLSSLHDGMYVIKCTTDGVVSESKLIIRKNM